MGGVVLHESYTNYANYSSLFFEDPAREALFVNLNQSFEVSVDPESSEWEVCERECHTPSYFMALTIQVVYKGKTETTELLKLYDVDISVAKEYKGANYYTDKEWSESIGSATSIPDLFDKVMNGDYTEYPSDEQLHDMYLWLLKHNYITSDGKFDTQRLITDFRNMKTDCSGKYTWEQWQEMALPIIDAIICYALRVSKAE